MSQRQKQDEQRTRDAQRDLDRITATGEVVGTSALRRAAEHTRDHFAAKDAHHAASETDWAELWGRRIGRGLSLIGVIVLVTYLVITYVLPR